MPAFAYTAHQVADAVANGTAYQAPATVYLRLVYSAPSKNVPGDEITLGSYAPVTFAQSGWTNDAGGNLTNTADVVFPEATADYDGDVVAVESHDAASAGNALWWINLTTPKTIVSGQTPKFLAGYLVFSVV